MLRLAILLCHLCGVIIRLRLPPIHPVELDHDAGHAAVHPELLRLGALHICLVGCPLLRTHSTSTES